MRWLFLLLLMLNAFYYIWHQQEAPLRAKEVLPLSLYRAGQHDIQLLSESESGRDASGQAREVDEKCLYLGGFSRQEEARTIEQRLLSLDVQSELQSLQANGASTYWVKINPGSRRLVGEGLLNGLIQDFPQMKNKIISCEGVATAE